VAKSQRDAAMKWHVRLFPRKRAQKNPASEFSHPQAIANGGESG
jgi:hypothetical protein